METKPLIHVSAPDHPEAGRRNLPLERGPVAMPPMRGPGPCGGPVSLGGPEPRLLALGCLFLLDTWCPRTFPGRGTGPVYCWKGRTSDHRGPVVWL